MRSKRSMAWAIWSRTLMIMTSSILVPLLRGQFAQLGDLLG